MVLNYDFKKTFSNNEQETCSIMKKWCKGQKQIIFFIPDAKKKKKNVLFIKNSNTFLVWVFLGGRREIAVSLVLAFVLFNSFP